MEMSNYLKICSIAAICTTFIYNNVEARTGSYPTSSICENEKRYQAAFMIYSSRISTLGMHTPEMLKAIKIESIKDADELIKLLEETAPK